MEFLLQNIDWLGDQLENFDEDDYIIFDCPGQIELYSHLPVMRDLAQALSSWGFRVMSVYLLDALFVLEPAKFISGCMQSLSCMLQLELPHVNVITKCDIADKEQVERVLDSEGAWMVNALEQQTTARLKPLTRALSSVIDDYMIVSFVMLDVTDEESIEDVLARTDSAIQYGKRDDAAVNLSLSLSLSSRRRGCGAADPTRRRLGRSRDGRRRRLKSPRGPRLYWFV
jgi:hypothetical protein